MQRDTVLEATLVAKYVVMAPLLNERTRRLWAALLHEDPLPVGRRGPPFSSPQEPHYGDEVEGSSHV